MAGYSEQPIEMSLGRRLQRVLRRSCSQLEKLPRITRVTQMSLNKITEHDGEMQARSR